MIKHLGAKVGLAEATVPPRLVPVIDLQADEDDTTIASLMNTRSSGASSCAHLYCQSSL
jgi:hypothetical protein